MPQSESPETRLKGLLETKPDKDSLAQGVEETDRLDEDEYDQRIRAESFGVEKHWKNKIRPWLHWLLFGVILILTVAFVTLLIAYLLHVIGLYNISGDIEAVKALLGKIWNIFLISLATLFMQQLWPKK